MRVRALEAAPLLLSNGEGAIVGDLLPFYIEQDVAAEDQALLRARRERQHAWQCSEECSEEYSEEYRQHAWHGSG